MDKIILSCKNICKSFSDGRESNSVDILNNINLDIYKGDLISICGKSGSGKSTLLYIMSSLLSPDSGNVLLFGKDIYKSTRKEFLSFRQKNIGFVFQDNMLIDELTVKENVFLPIQIAHKKKGFKRVIELAEYMEIENLFDKKANLLSSGEKSRVSLLRALAIEKDIIFLDEPTGALDNMNAKKIENLILNLSKNYSITFVYVTHDVNFAQRAKRQFEIVNKNLVTKIC